MHPPQKKVTWYLGTMGFGYEDWHGGFYPDEMSSRNFLPYYSRVFNAVEIDSTFYGTPRTETVQRWASITPDNFRFCLKTPRAITHDLGLIGARGLMQEFVNTVSLLGDKLGPILLQFPPSFTMDQFANLETFLQDLPQGAKFAVEIRDASWYQDPGRVDDLLAQHQVAWAATQYPNLPARISTTASFLYIRWIGQHGTYQHHTHERVDLSEELQAWLQNLEEPLKQVNEVFGFFNNDYAGFAPGTATRFKHLAGLPADAYQPPVQGRLF